MKLQQSDLIIKIEKLLNKFFNYDSYRFQEDISWVLEKVKTIIEKTKEPEYKELGYNTYLLFDSEEYERAKQVFEVIYPKIKQVKEQRVLFYNIIATIKLNEETYFDLIFNEVKQLKKDNRCLA